MSKRSLHRVAIKLCILLLSVSASYHCPVRTQHERKIQWNLAKAAIGMNMTGFDKRASSYITQFYSFQSGIALFNASGMPLAYVNVYKCGSNAIRSNLRRQTTRIIGLQRRHEVLLTSADAFFRAKARFGLAPFTAFSFVRDPISHFESGLKEYLYRCGSRCGVSADGAITPAIISREISNLLIFRSRSDKDISHVYPMSGALSTFGINLSFVGKIERFDLDWSRLQSLMRLPSRKFNSTIIHHRSSALSGTMTRAFSDLMEVDNHKYLLALCYLLYDDFICFDYPLPPPCVNISAQKFTGPRHRWDGPSDKYSGVAMRDYIRNKRKSKRGKMMNVTSASVTTGARRTTLSRRRLQEVQNPSHDISSEFWLDSEEEESV